jgi:hypothetical protein
MDNRAKIPALALLGLSCTECTDRTGSGGDDPIVGDWLAVDIDGRKFPDLGERGIKSNWELEIESDHGGRFLYYGEYQEDGVTQRYEYYSEHTVDVSDAPRYRITVETDLIIALIGEDSSVTTASDTDYSATDYSATYGSTYSGTDGGDLTSGGLDDPDDDAVAFDEFELELAGPPRPVRAPTMVLDCELKAEQLHCTRQIAAGDDQEFVQWKFARRPEGE